MASPGNDFSGSEVLTPPAPGKPSQSLVTAPPLSYGTPGTFGAAATAGPEVLHGGFNQKWLFNCLRRRWLMATLLGLLAAAVGAGILWWLFPQSSRTSALLRVEAKPPTKVLTDERGRLTDKEIDMFAANQAALIKSNNVLQAALTPRRINELSAVQRQDDPIQWLVEDLRVSYPNDGEILEVRYDGDEDPAEMVMIIDQIIKSYEEEILQKDRDERAAIRADLRAMHDEVEENLAEMRVEYNRKVESFGGADSGSAEIEISMLSNSLRTLETRIATQEKELAELEVNTNVAVQQARSPSVVEAAIAAELDADPTVALYQQEMFTIDQRIRQLSSIGKNPNSPELKRLYGQKRQAAQQLEDYRRQAEVQIRQNFASKPNEMLQAIVLHYQLQKKGLEESLEELKAEYADKEERLVQKGARNPELLMLMMKIEQEEEIERTLDIKTRDQQLTAKHEDARISVIQNAYTSENINWIERVAIATIGGLAALVTTCYCVALIDFRRRRLNGPADVDDGLGIRVLGVLPAITSRRALAGKTLAAAQVVEGIDNVRATLMHDSTTRQRQIVLVTSSASMDGCSTVATQLAVSLAKAGRRTLLVDGDLRAPSLHGLFGLPMEDGFSEVLRSEIDVADAIRLTDREGLYVLTAGVTDMDAIHALATDLPQPIFEKMRAQFDFVVIDGAPALGMSDSLSLGQYADGAILAVLRDHSELNNINKTSDLLRRMGIPLIGAVVNGVPMKADRRVTRLLKSQGSSQRKLPAAAPAAAAAKPSKNSQTVADSTEVGNRDEDFASGLDDRLDDIDIDEL